METIVTALKEKLYLSLSLSKENKSKSISITEPSHLEDWTILYSQIKEFLLANDGNEISFITMSDPIERLVEETVPLFFQLWEIENGVDKYLFTMYTQLQKIQDDLLALQSNGLFTRHILDTIRIKLSNLLPQIEQVVESHDCFHQAKEILIVKHKFCTLSLLNLAKEMDALSPVLLAIHQRLFEINMELQGLLARKNPHAFSLMQVQVLQEVSLYIMFL